MTSKPYVANPKSPATFAPQMQNSLQSLPLIFFGTPDFAVASLRALVEAGCKVLAVVTAPDRESGRGLKLQPSPVKEYALEQGLPVLQPTNMKSPDFQAELRSFNARLQVVVAFRMMPEAVWNMPELGTVNVHASLLPLYRGAAPINRAIMNGETETGVTTFRLKHEIDTGNILMQERVPILPTDNAGTLYETLMEKGAKLLIKTLEKMAVGDTKGIPQTAYTAEMPHAPKIFKEATRIDFTKSCHEVLNQIRGLSPYPAAFTEMNGKIVKVYAAVLGSETDTLPAAGSVISDGKTSLQLACADRLISLTDVQQQGKKRMAVADFLRGFRV